MGSNDLVRSVRLDDNAIQAILDRLDSVAAEQPERACSGDTFPYRQKGVVLHLQQPGDANTAAFLVPTRCLSASELCFLHGGFIHAGSRCMVQLISTHGSWDDVPAVCTSCTHAQGAIHEIRVRFEGQVDPGLYCPEALRVRILLAEDDNTIARLAQAHLRRLNAEVVHVADGEAAVEAAARTLFDIVMMDMEMPGLNGFEATKKLRAIGYTGLIVACTALTSPEDRERCLKAGCDQHLGKPYTATELAKLCRSQKQEPLFSTMMNEPGMAEVIDKFIAALPGTIRQMEEAWHAREREKVEQMARSLKGQAGSFGFAPIGEAAEALERVLRSNGRDANVQEFLNDLVKFCLLARSSTRGVRAAQKA